MTDNRPALLVCGSRDIYFGTEVQEQQFFYNIAEKAISNGWQLIAGDAQGVDKGIAYACTAKAMRHLDPFMTVYGIQAKPRHRIASPTIQYVNVGEFYPTYTLRDEYMVGQADYIYCIWNGKSKGTAHVFDYARNQGFVVDDNLWMKVV